MYAVFRRTSGSGLKHSLAVFVIGLFGSISIASAAGWVSSTRPDAPGAALCKALLKRLNRFPPQCSRASLESYPGFSSLPWTVLNPRQHLELITSLLLTVGRGPEASIHSSALQIEHSRAGAKSFADQGGGLQVWRGHVLSAFGADGERPAPPGPQVFVQLIYKFGGSTAMEPCPGNSTKEWFRETFLVNAKMTGPDIRVRSGVAGLVFGDVPMLFHSEVVFIGQTNLFNDVPPYGLGQRCNFEPAAPSGAEK